MKQRRLREPRSSITNNGLKLKKNTQFLKKNSDFFLHDDLNFQNQNQIYIHLPFDLAGGTIDFGFSYSGESGEEADSVETFGRNFLPVLDIINVTPIRSVPTREPCEIVKRCEFQLRWNRIERGEESRRIHEL